MALSDYERRVLAEIEVELRCTSTSTRLRRARPIVIIAACLVVVAGIAAMGSLLLPSAAAAGLSSLAGLLAGFVVAVERERARLL
ncbi:MAG TPA: hypothetical protein VFT67_17095 [Jatrophihabitantaceae bacterium]|nr:hypothetical protein [Jatrophihabitantaceae bacterium]